MKVRTEKEWLELLEEYDLSHESMSSFCKRKNISKGSFYYWLAKNKEKKPDVLRMLPVVTHETKPVDGVELLMPKGLCLRFSAQTPARYVADIIRALV